MTHAPVHSLVVATTNRGKLEELRALLVGLPVEVLSLDDVVKRKITVIEDGKTFAENAVKKARTIAAVTSMLTIADDSGLEVDALDGAPGVRSARYASARATDAENNAHLLAQLDALGDPTSGVEDTFKARFRCVLALVDPYAHDAEPRVVEGACEGKITRTPRGSGGFGYDPIFLVDGTGKTMAELSQDEKNRVSHRSRAFQALRPVLEEVLFARDVAIERIARV